jgi:heat shock protein HslJ
MEDRNWKITELFGKSVNREATTHFIRLIAAEKTITAKAGCNNIGGNYEKKAGNRIRFSGMVATRMACTDMEAEEALIKVFETADTFIIQDTVLLFYNTPHTCIARFVEAPKEK